VLQALGGSKSDRWNNVLVSQAIQTLWLKHSDKEARDFQMGATFVALMGIRPKDEIEGMMAAQLVAAHNAAMECYRRAMIDEQTFEGRRENLNLEHVHVHAGGQAVVGMVETPGGGVHPKSKEQPHAIAYAPQPTMRSPNPERERVPSGSDAEWPLPDARRDVAGGSEG
jgi:hypothetical protein